MKTVHATSVAIDNVAVLIRGEPGSGKSDLALRLIDHGAVLIADDYTNLIRTGHELTASPPPKIAGRIEVRGIGIEELPYVSGVVVGLLVDLMPGQKLERLPESSREEIEGVKIKRVSISSFEASAVAKVRLAAKATSARGTFY